MTADDGSTTRLLGPGRPGRRRVLAAIVTLLIVTTTVSPLGVAPTDGQTDYTTTPTGTATPYGLDDTGRISPERAVDRDDAVVTEPVGVVIRLDADAAIPRAEGLAIRRVTTGEGGRAAYARAPLAIVGKLSDRPGVRSIRITSRPSTRDGVADGVTVVHADAVHRTGITGRNVTVGVIDAGFRISHPAIAANVGAYREFEAGGGGWTHGTAVASVVADTAPGTTIHMAAVGDRVTGREYTAAVEWLLDSGADVIVDAGSYHTQPGDGNGTITQAAAVAAEDAVFVTSTGNYAGGYWAGTGSGNATADDWVQFNGTESNPLSGSVSGRVQATLRWSAPSAAYDLYLFRKRPGADAIVASSAAAETGGYASLDIAVPPGEYYLAALVTEPPANATRLRLVVNRPLANRTTARPAPPATASGVLAVGAVRNGAVRPFSVAGADLVAPDVVAAEAIDVRGGTSFAAPYVAGVAALTIAATPEADPATVRDRLQSGATDVGPPGVDPLTGHGLVDAFATVRQPERTATGLVSGPDSPSSSRVVSRSDSLAINATRSSD